MPNRDSYQLMLDAVQAFHDKHDFKSTGGEELTYRVALMAEELGEISSCVTKGKDKQDDKSDQKKNQDEKKDNKDQKQRPNQLTPEQMKQLLEAMNNEENKTQKKLNEQKAKGKKIKRAKDW